MVSLQPDRRHPAAVGILQGLLQIVVIVTATTQIFETVGFDVVYLCGFVFIGQADGREKLPFRFVEFSLMQVTGALEPMSLGGIQVVVGDGRLLQ